MTIELQTQTSTPAMVANHLQNIQGFLLCNTPEAWVEHALQNINALLVDHAHCEKKAAFTALSLIHRYSEHDTLLQKLSRLAREELRHFEQVLKIMRRRGITFKYLTASRYARMLRKEVRNHEPCKLIDILIIGALIEARSCERFAILAPHLDAELGDFYQGLLNAEARHFNDYLQLARSFSMKPIDDRIDELKKIESDLILCPDPEFRFHSGLPSAVK